MVRIDGRDDLSRQVQLPREQGTLRPADRRVGPHRPGSPPLPRGSQPGRPQPRNPDDRRRADPGRWAHAERPTTSRSLTARPRGELENFRYAFPAPSSPSVRGGAGAGVRAEGAGAGPPADDRLGAVPVAGEPARPADRPALRVRRRERAGPPEVHHGLKAVPSLRKGRTKARETEPVRPVPDEHVEVVRPHLSRQLAAVVDLQRLYSGPVGARS